MENNNSKYFQYHSRGHGALIKPNSSQYQVPMRALDQNTPHNPPVSGNLRATPSTLQPNFSLSAHQANPQLNPSLGAPRTPPQKITYHIYRQNDAVRSSPPVKTLIFDTVSPSTRHAFTHGDERPSKRYKQTYDGYFSPTLDERIEATALQTRPSAISFMSTGNEEGSRATRAPDSQTGDLMACTDATDDHQTDSKGLKKIPVDSNIVPPAWIQGKLRKHTPQAVERKYTLSSEDWLSEDVLVEYTDSLIIKPHPKGGDRGLPTTENEEATLAKQIYDAIVDSGHFYGSTTGAVLKLLTGGFDQVYIQKRSIDVVNELKEYHTRGVAVTNYANPNIISSTGNPAKGSERDDTCEERTKNILASLRFCKSVAADVLMAKEALATVLILAPKARMVAKLSYKESNDGRGVNHKKLREKASAFDAKDQAQETM